jgi:HEAT repeat protein
MASSKQDVKSLMKELKRFIDCEERVEARESTIEAAKRLGELGDPSALKILISAYDKLVGLERRGVIRKELSLGSMFAFQLKDEVELALERLQIDETIKKGKERPDVLIGALNHESPAVRRISAKALGIIKEPGALKPLINALLTDREKSVAINAAEALGEIGDANAVDALISTLQNEDKWAVFGAAMKALGKLKDSRALGAIAHILENGSYWDRATAAESLGALGDSKAVEPLIAAYKNDKDENVKRSAGEALRKIGTPEALEAIKS